MTLNTIGGVTYRLVIGLGCSQVSVSMTVDTLNPQGFEPSHGTRFMAGHAITDLMGSREGKPALPVDFTDVFNDPGFWSMASGTIRTQSAFVQIIMTIKAFLWCR